MEQKFTAEELSAALAAEREEKARILRQVAAERILREKGLPEFFSQMDLGGDEAQVRSMAEQIAAWHSESVRTAVQSRFVPYTPAGGTPRTDTDPAELTDEEYYRRLGK